jgi:translin
MEKLKVLVDKVESELVQLDEHREKVIKLSRKINRVSGKGIARIVKGEECGPLLQEARTIISEIGEVMRDLAPISSWKITGSGVEEYVEFEILFAIVFGNDIPDHETLQVPSSLWLTGLADVPGELRRILLNNLIGGKLAEASELLDKLQLIFNQITGLEFSKNIVPNLRRKIDSVRMLLERTESDFAHAKIRQNID